MTAAIALSDVVLAVVVFVITARSDQGLALAARLSGVWTQWLQGGLDDADLARLETLAGHLRRGLLALVFTWSFVTGALVALSRL